VRRSVTEDELVAVLDRWAGTPVAVRVVTCGAELVVVLRGRLSRRTGAKHPSVFWPVECEGRARGSDEAEEPGVYLHPRIFAGAWIHVGDGVVEWRQGDVVVNVRRV
jgi:hypothetical protein